MFLRRKEIDEERKNYLQTSLGFGSAGGGQLALNLLSAIHCSLKLADLIIEARLKGLLRVRFYT